MLNQYTNYEGRSKAAFGLKGVCGFYESRDEDILEQSL